MSDIQVGGDHLSQTLQETSSEEAPKGSLNSTSSGKIKVTLLTCQWGSTKGGLSTMNRELAIQLAKDDSMEVCMYLPAFSDEDKKAAEKCKVHLLKAEEKPGYEPIDWLASVPRNHQMNVVIGHGIDLGKQVPHIKQSRPECKWIQVVHTDPEENGMFKSPDEAAAKGEKKHDDEMKLCQKADQIVAIGPKLADTYSSVFEEEKVIDLTPGIFSESPCIKEGTKERKTFNVFVFGRGDSEDFLLEGYDIAARAVAELKDEEPPVKLVFVGAPTGKKEEVKGMLLKTGISPRQFIVRSGKKRGQLAQQFNQADLVIMPSRTEGFGLAALEALSAGLPVLVSRNSGFRVALEKVPFGMNVVVNSEDPAEWAKAIRGVRSKPRNVRLKEASDLHKNYSEKYKWEEQCSGLIKKIRELVGIPTSLLRARECGQAAAVKDPSPPIRKNKRRAAAVKDPSPPIRTKKRRAAAVKDPSAPIRTKKRRAAAVKDPSPPIRTKKRRAAAVKDPSPPIRTKKRRAAAVKDPSPPIRTKKRRAAAVKDPSPPMRKKKRRAAAVKDPSPPIRTKKRRAAAVNVPSPQIRKNKRRDTLQGLSKLRHKFPYFVNRKTDELSRIVKCLDPENKECQGVFIDGAPGIGKTTLATEAAHELRNDKRNVVVAYIDCKDINSFESFAGTVIEQISRSPSVDDPAAEIKKRLIASSDYFYILFLDNFECFLTENNNQQAGQPSIAGAPSRDCRERVKRFIGEIAKRPTNIKFLVTSSEGSCFPTLAMETIELHPFDKHEFSKLLGKVRCADKMSDEECEELCKSCSGIPLVLHTLISLQKDLKCFVKLPPKERTTFLRKMKTVPEEKKIGVCLDVCFQRLTPQVQLTLLRLCLYKGLFTPDKAAKIFCSPESREHNLRAIVLELGRCNLLHLQKDKNKYTFLTVIRDHFKLKGKRQEYHEEIQRARDLLIDYLISFLKETFKVFLGKNSVKSAIEEFSGEKENVMQLVEWIDKGEMDEERVKKCIDVFNVAGEMLAKMMAKFNYRTVYKSLAEKCRKMGDQRRLAECLTSLGIKEIFNCICTTGLCNKAIERARPSLEKAHRIQTHLQVNTGNSRAQCLAKLGRCLVRSSDTEGGKAMIEEAIRIRKATIDTPIDHEEEGGENVCHVMLVATYNDMAVALSFENHHREAVNIRRNQVMPIYRERLGDHPFTATILNNMSNNHRDLGEFKAAEQYAKQALDIRRELLADHRDTIKSFFDLGMALKANRKFKEARDFLEQCKTMQEKVVNDETLEQNTEEELRDVNRLLEMQQSEGHDQ
ncbi:uncharacterized protein [Acropora muricata]|uniref:uncharacterized protein n=1 Tax=Acropora muricata TaxID=159855 RepID=UPI0034E45009